MIVIGACALLQQTASSNADVKGEDKDKSEGSATNDGNDDDKEITDDALLELAITQNMLYCNKAIINNSPAKCAEQWLIQSDAISPLVENRYMVSYYIIGAHSVALVRTDSPTHTHTQKMIEEEEKSVETLLELAMLESSKISDGDERLKNEANVLFTKGKFYASRSKSDVAIKYFEQTKTVFDKIEQKDKGNNPFEEIIKFEKQQQQKQQQTKKSQNRLAEFV